MSKASSKTNLNSGKPLENGTQGGGDWGSPAVSAPSWGGNDSGAGFDWSQPVTKAEDDELKLDWGDDKDDDVEDGDDDDGLTMKKPETNDGGSEHGGTKLQRENSQVRITCLEMRLCEEQVSNSHVSTGRVRGWRDRRAAEVPRLSENLNDGAAHTGHRLRGGWRETPISALQLAGKRDCCHA